MYVLIAAVFIMPTILYIMNIIYLRENRKGLYEPDKRETRTLLIFDVLMLLVGIAVVAFHIFLSVLAFASPDVEFFGIITVYAIGAGLFLYLICLNAYFIWQLVKLLRRS